MKINQEQFDTAQKNFSQEKLSIAQREKMLAHIYAAHPFVVPQHVPSPYVSFFHKKSFAVMVAAILFVSGTSFVSANSLPGDALYSIKTEVIEPVAQALVPKSEKQDYSLLLLEKRVKEVDDLKKKDALTVEAEAKSFMATKKIIKNLEKDASHKKETSVEASIEIYNARMSSEFQIIIDTKKPKEKEDKPVENVPSTSLETSNKDNGEVPLFNDSDIVEEVNEDIGVIPDMGVQSEGEEETIDIPTKLPNLNKPAVPRSIGL